MDTLQQRSVLLPTPPLVATPSFNPSQAHLYYGPRPARQKCSGLEELAKASKLFTVLQPPHAEVPLNPAIPATSQIFKIHNNQGEHILTAAEMKLPICFIRLRSWQCFFYICSKDGNPIMTLMQRNDGCFVRFNPMDWALERCYQADRLLVPKHKTRNLSLLEELPSHPHLEHVDGSFLGHYFNGQTDTAILDTNFTPILSFKRRGSLLDGLGHDMGNEALDPEDYRGRKGGKVSENDVITSPEGSQRGVSYDLVEEYRQVGRLQSHASLRKLLFDTSLDKCFACTFPHAFTQVDKALVLGFLLYKQRSALWGEKMLHTFMFIFIIGVILLTVVSILFDIFYRFDPDFRI